MSDPEAGSLLDRVRASAREHVAEDRLTLPIGDGVVGVRYRASGISFADYLEIRETLATNDAPALLVAALDLMVRTCECLVVRDGDGGWKGLHELLDRRAPFTIGDPASLEALDLNAETVLEQHVADVENGTARHTALVIMTAYGTATLVGLDAEQQAVELMLFMQGRTEADRLPPA